MKNLNTSFFNIMLNYFSLEAGLQGIAKNNSIEQKNQCRNSCDIEAYASVKNHRRENV